MSGTPESTAKPASPTRVELVISLRSDVCPACGGAKMPGQTLCRKEYSRLPKPGRMRLYQRLGHGYEDAVQWALEQLGATEFQLPRAREES